jgi:acyl-coenzyme A thioesterase PaaI-like protein
MEVTVAESTVRREAASPFGEWADSVGSLMSYRYLASQPHALDRSHAEGRMKLRPDLRTSAGAVLAAPLTIAMLDVAGINVDRMWILALTQTNVEILDAATDVGEVYLRGHITSEARSQIFTEARLYDAGDRDRVIGFGTANWSVICPTPEGFQYPEPGRGVEHANELPPLWQAYTGRRREDDMLEIPSLRPEIGTDRLHHGPMLVITEATAVEAAADALGTADVAVEHLGMTIVAPGRAGPFVARPVLIATSSGTVGCRVELRDHGRDDRLVATAFVRLRAC